MNALAPLLVSLVMIVLLTALIYAPLRLLYRLPSWLQARRTRRLVRNFKLNRCSHCGYDIRVKTARCPECGHHIPLTPIF